MNRIAILLHDGYYGCGTGAGRSNHALLRVLTRHLPHTALRVMPIHLTAASPEHDSAWHATTRALLTNQHTVIHPIDNGTRGHTRFGGLDHFRHACASAADHLNALPEVEQPELIIALDAPFHGIAPLLTPHLAARILLVPRSTARLHAPEEHDRIAWEHTGLTALTAAGGHVAAISAHMRTHLSSAYPVPARAIVDMPNGLTRDERDHASQVTPPPLPQSARDGFLLAVGRAATYKGFDDLLDALHHLRHRAVAVPHLVLAAVTETDTPTAYQRHLNERIHTLALGATLLTRYDPTLPGLYTHSALRGLIVPSRAEPFGRIPLEAFAAGAAPVITTTAGGLGETVTNGINGLTATPSDPTALASAISGGLTLDAHEVNAMRAAGLRTAHERDYDHSVLTALNRIAPWVPTPDAGQPQSV